MGLRDFLPVVRPAALRQASVPVLAAVPPRLLALVLGAALPRRPLAPVLPAVLPQRVPTQVLAKSVPRWVPRAAQSLILVREEEAARCQGQVGLGRYRPLRGESPEGANADPGQSACNPDRCRPVFGGTAIPRVRRVISAAQDAVHPRRQSYGSGYAASPLRTPPTVPHAPVSS